MNLRRFQVFCACVPNPTCFLADRFLDRILGTWELFHVHLSTAKFGKVGVVGPTTFRLGRFSTIVPHEPLKVEYLRRTAALVESWWKGCMWEYDWNVHWLNTYARLHSYYCIHFYISALMIGTIFKIDWDTAPLHHELGHLYNNIGVYIYIYIYQIYNIYIYIYNIYTNKLWSWAVLIHTPPA